MKFLIYYYGILQALHMVMNGFVIWGDREGMIGVLTDKSDVVSWLMTSAYLDFFAASPLGVVFLVLFLRGSRWARVIGLVSLSLAMVSAAIYEFAWIGFSWANVGIHVLFVPVVVLLVLMLRGGFEIKKH